VARLRGKRPRQEPGAATTPAQPSFVRPVEGGIELSIKVVPGASRSEIAGVLGDRLKVRVTAPPEGGKANRALVELLRDWLGVREVAIVSGRGSPEKTVRAEGVTELDEGLLTRLGRGARS
jgi:uncharacterized protein